MFKKNNLKRTILFVFFGSFLTISLIFGTLLYFNYKLSNILEEKDEQTIRQNTSVDDIAKLTPRLLGFSEPKTYLLLFLNNTELRPGGGFIGTYGVVKFTNGKMEILKIDGTENLDYDAPKTPVITPPEPIDTYLAVDRWWFRDSNWSPDFAESSKKALEFYNLEQGEYASEIDGVLAITTDVLEHFLGITGPVKVEGITFTSENAVEKLEYEVEYGYASRGVKIEDRKKIVGEFMDELSKKVRNGLIFNWHDYLNIVTNLADKKHIMIYSLDAETENLLHKMGWSGIVKQTNRDYLLWVDANLGALKTDHALDRSLFYEIKKNNADLYEATVKMRYVHKKGIDWRTSRYRTYARVYVPEGSEFVKAYSEMEGKKTMIPSYGIKKENDLGKTSFGIYFEVKPLETIDLSFVYILPARIKEQIDAGDYELSVQKQLGTNNHGLTLGLYFDKNLRRANPGEEQSEWGDEVYKYSTDLAVDRYFKVGF